jgi:hypothetical protein
MPRIDPDSGCSVFVLDSDADINEGLSYFYSDYVSVVWNNKFSIWFFFANAGTQSEKPQKKYSIK